MEFWAIPFTCCVIAFGIYESDHRSKQIAIQEAMEVRRVNKFEEEVHLQDSLIQQPEIGDFYRVSFFGDHIKNSIKKKKLYILPLRVADFNETSIQLFCPFSNPYDIKERIDNKVEMLAAFSGSGEEEGLYAWVDKTSLSKAVNRVQDTHEVAHVPMPALVEKDPVAVANVWRMDGPIFKKFSGYWRYNKVSLTIKNTGWPATIEEVRYKVQTPGNKISWRKIKPYGPERRDGINYNDDAVIRIDQKFHIESGYTAGEPTHLELFCMDTKGQRYRVDFLRKGEKVTIKKNRI